MFGLFKSKEYGDQVVKQMKKYVGFSKMSLENEAPIPFKAKNEFFICSIPVKMGTYKNNGNFAYGAVTARVKIVKGVSARLGAGKMGMEKSVVFDNEGVLHITTHRMVFNGAHTNISVPFNKVIDFTLDPTGSHLQVDRETGKVLWFEITEKPSVDDMAKAMTFGRNAVDVRDLPKRLAA